MSLFVDLLSCDSNPFIYKLVWLGTFVTVVAMNDLNQDVCALVDCDALSLIRNSVDGC